MRRLTSWYAARRNRPLSVRWPMRARAGIAACVGLTLLLAGQAPVGAQATRTWVSGVGDDANPCSRTAPCKTFAGAISKTAAGGEINAIDPGGFGAVTITKSISIVGEGVTAGIISAGTSGVIVNAGVNDVVVLRGLDIDGVGTGINGIRYLAGRAVFVENVTINGINGSPGFGIDVSKTADGELYVTNSQIRNTGTASTGAGVRLTTTAGQIKAVFDGVSIENNLIGIQATDRVNATIRDSVISGHTNQGILVQSTAGSGVTVESTVLTGNTTGLHVEGNNQSIARIANVVVTNNTNGLVSATGGQIITFGNNMIFGNTNNGTPTGTLPLQ